MRLPSELGVMHLSPKKVERMLGIAPQVSLREGLRREWDWLLENRHRWTTMSYLALSSSTAQPLDAALRSG